MDFLPRQGRLQKKFATPNRSVVPMSETIQSVVVTSTADGRIVENDEYILTEKTRIIEVLREKYGDVDESQLVWVMIKKKDAAGDKPVKP